MLFQGDVIISECIRQGIEDLRNNLWLLDDVFGQFITEDVLKNKYGQKEIDNAKEWLKNNKIDVNMRHRIDKEQLPCVTIAMAGSTEIEDLKHLADQSVETETLMPNQIGKPIPYIVKPFVPEGYDPDSGELSIASDISLFGVAAGQILVDPESGNGYVIQDIFSDGIVLEPNLELTGSKFGIIPKYPFYKARREHSFFQETYQIGCHVHGDPAPLLWLHSLVVYILLRYRESLLEGRCFAQSTFSSSDLTPNNDFGLPGGENVYSRYITLSGQVENSWLKSPKRIVEATSLSEDFGVKTGIKICSNLDSPEFINESEESWITTESDDDAGDNL